MARETNLVTIIGEDSYKKLRSSKCLLVGAGGIGSELLKDIILMEFGEIHIVDLDTIDLSNLNRQFLFRQKDIKQPKSTTAVKAVQHFNNSKLVPYQGNVMDISTFPLHWFEQFDIIFNALDNLAARRYVNKISQFLSLPLIESGTAGFDGYMQPIIPGKSECFECTTKETPKTFPVCTIRSTPSQPIHCIVWAKNFLFNQLFASEVSVNEDDDNQDWGTDDAEEIKHIKQETNELHELQKIIISNDVSRIPEILNKLFIQDINKLLAIGNLWKTRTKPVPLSDSQINGSIKTTKFGSNSVGTLQEQINHFINITQKLMDRYAKEQNHIEFDKDDVDTLEFVVTAANIRSHIFNIPMKSVFDIKQIAGNIIPAIATTNAIVAGASSLISLRVLDLLKYAPITKYTDLNMAFTAKASNLSQNRYLSNPKLAPPNCNCPVCSKVCRGVIKLSSECVKKMKLSDLVGLIREKYTYPQDISLLDATNQRLLLDFDFEDLNDRTLSEVNLGNGSIILFSDEEGDTMIRKSIELYLSVDDELPCDTCRLPDIQVPLVKTGNSTSTNEEQERGEKGTDAVTTANSHGEDGIVILDDDENEIVIDMEPMNGSKKRPIDTEVSETSSNKRTKLANESTNFDIVGLD
ncbi:E1 ubiquitin-activating protein UBA2 [Saccharomyces paradoxus]|uniref:Ubiquitin-activating enzyme E1-like n=1 Tax=Saccharomyces paradoxus TaxID=27291 RepID=A0A8B8UPC8_SACPA|nr:Uba2 [Saccharomyces paradoxus]QHS72581.1 Uba2 [Saccharomyces paradoxus]